MRYEVNTTWADNPNKVKLSTDFYPYENLIADWNVDLNGWDITNVESLKVDTKKPTSLLARESIKVSAIDAFETVAVERTFVGKPNTTYYFTCGIRNEGALTSRVFINAEKSFNLNTYANKQEIKVTTDDSGELKVLIDFHEVTPSIQAGSPIAGWIGSFMLVEVPEEANSKTIEELGDIFELTLSNRTSPSWRSLLKSFASRRGNYLLPTSYFVVVDGIGIFDINTTLEDANYTSDMEVIIVEHSQGTQISQAFLNDLRMMSMLEGDPMHVTYSAAEETRDLSYDAMSTFPRLQFFTGFETNTMIADGKPNAVSLTYHIKFYIPQSKILESVSPQMLMDRMNAVMRKLNYSANGGYDEFTKKPAIYSMQVKYIKDVQLPKN